jgi:hypothetical protein
MGSAVVVVSVFGGFIFGIPLVISIIRAFYNMYLERRERRADLMAAAERGLNGFNVENNNGSLALE